MGIGKRVRPTLVSQFAEIALSSQFAASRSFFVCLNSSGVRGAGTSEFCELIDYS
jgi:hypothetical protein